MSAVPDFRIICSAKQLNWSTKESFDLNGTVSHTFPLIRAQEAFDFNDSHDPSIRKIALTFDF